MIEMTIPGFGNLKIEHLVMDFNGTIAQVGCLVPAVRDHLQDLNKDLKLHVITADTFGKARSELTGLPCSIGVLDRDRQPEGKRDYIRRLGKHSCAAIGNGRNDRLMLREAALAIAVILAEGACAQVLLEADVICTSIRDALALLRQPLRLTATLRS